MEAKTGIGIFHRISNRRMAHPSGYIHGQCFTGAGGSHLHLFAVKELNTQIELITSQATFSMDFIYIYIYIYIYPK